MDNREDNERKRDLVTPICCLVGAGLWWFLSGSPSTVAMILAVTVLAYLCLGYYLLSVSLPQPQAQRRSEQFTPIPQSQSNPRKALTA